MGRVFGRRAEPDGNARPVPIRVLRADGQRIDLTSRDAGQALVATRQDWQKVAHSYRDMIGELRIAHRLLARSVARVRFYVAEERPWPQEPTPLDVDKPEHELDSQLAADAIHNFSLLPIDSNPDGFTARIVENLAIAGEVWIHWDERDRFHVRSTSEVSATQDGKVVIALLPNGGTGAQRQIDPETESLLRLWCPHPEFGQLADSAMRSLLDVCEDVVLAGREQRAAARSRVAANGLLLLPDSLSMMQDREADDEDGDDVTTDTFMADFTAAMLAPIRDDGDASAVVPLVIRGASEDLREVKHLTLQRADSESVNERQKAAVYRLLKSLDIQVEQVDGFGDTNHWGAWQIEASALKHQVLPNAQTVAAALVQAFLRPALLSLGHDEDAVDRITIGVDITPLSENPNRGQDARDAHGAMVISDASLREALGFDEDDAPTDEEVLRRLAATGNLPVGVIATLFGLSQQEVAQAATIEGTIAEGTEDPDAAAPALPSSERTAPGPGDTAPANPIPTGPITAAATIDDGWRVDVDASRRLADIDAALAERIAVAADDAIARALEKAGARVKSAAQKDKALSAKLVGLDPHLVPGTLGRSQVEEFASIADLLADGYARLKTLFRRWLAQSADEVAEVAVDLLGYPAGSEAAQQVRKETASRLGGNVDKAWVVLSEHLDEAAARVMFEPDPFNPAPVEDRGEISDRIIRPAEVNEVLNIAGGGTVHRSPMRDTTPGPGGFGTGPDVTGLLAEHDAVLLGWEWQYRPEILRGTNFTPHVRLDKVRFATWTDPKLDTDAATAWIGPYLYPGDHDFCSCRAVPILASPELIPDDPAVPDGESIVERRLREARESQRGQAAARVAAEDDAAGRVGTSLQMEVEVRDRITAGVARLREKHIEGAS